MKTWQEVKESPNYRRLRDSLELRSARRNLLFYSILTVVYGAVSMLSISDTPLKGTAQAAALLIMTLTVMLPITVFYGYRVFMIFHRINDYSFTEVLLDKPRSGMGRGAMYFEVTVRDRFGAEISIQTHEIFSSRSEGIAPLEDYINKTVLIGYNNATEYVVVIG